MKRDKRCKHATLRLGGAVEMASLAHYKIPSFQGLGTIAAAFPRLKDAEMTNSDRYGMIFVGKGENDDDLALAFANRHGLATSATGTGKTVTEPKLPALSAR
jgi:hypothetical protein